MRMVVNWQVWQGQRAELSAYLRDANGPMSPGADVKINVTRYPDGRHVIAEYTAVIGERGELKWEIPLGSRIYPGLYHVKAARGDEVIALGLLEVV